MSNLRPLLRRSGLTQTELANRLRARGIQISDATVSRWINGHITPPVSALAVVLELLNASDAERLLLLEMEAVKVRPLTPA